MYYYAVTLLKDLPNIKAGFSFSISEDCLNKRFVFRSRKDGMSDSDYTDAIYEILRYKNKSDWVKFELDYSQAVEVICPKCATFGMFTFSDDKPEYKYDDGVSKWYTNSGLQCPCGNKVYTHKTCIKTRVN